MNKGELRHLFIGLLIGGMVVLFACLFLGGTGEKYVPFGSNNDKLVNTRTGQVWIGGDTGSEWHPSSNPIE